MTALAHPSPSGRPLRLERARLLAVSAAVALHLLLTLGVAGVWRHSAREAPPAPQVVMLSLVSRPAEPEAVPMPLPVPEMVPEPVPQPDSGPVETMPEPVPGAPARVADAAVAGPAGILTAEGGQAGFAPGCTAAGRRRAQRGLRSGLRADA